MKKIAVVALITAVLSATAWAGEVSESLAAEYLKLSKMEEIINATISQYENQLPAQTKPEDKAKFHDLLVGAMGWEAIKGQLLDEVKHVFTQKELEASIAFMKTPEGASATAKGPEFSQRMASIISGNLQKIMAPAAPKKAAQP